MVIMEAFIERTFGRARSRTVHGLGKNRTPSPAQAKTYLHALCLGRDDAKTHIALRIDLRILLTWLIERGRLEIFRDGRRCGLRRKRADRGKGRQHRNGLSQRPAPQPNPRRRGDIITQTY